MDRERVDDDRPLYGRLAWAYEPVVAQPAGPAVDRITEIFAEALGPPPTVFVVDAGCGTGRYAHALADRGFRVVGVDRSSALIEQALAARADRSGQAAPPSSAGSVPDRPTGAGFVNADLLSWQPPGPVDAVLCRGVLNDLVEDDDRAAAFAAFGAWLRPGGLLLADVRDWGATVERYREAGPVVRTVERDGRTLQFSTSTRLDHESRRMLVHERYTEPGREEDHDFVMRCWTREEVRALAVSHHFSEPDIATGMQAGIATDRLLIKAFRSV